MRAAHRLVQVHVLCSRRMTRATIALVCMYEYQLVGVILTVERILTFYLFPSATHIKVFTKVP